MIRVHITRALYAALLLVGFAALARVGAHGLRDHLLVVGAIAALSVTTNLIGHRLRLVMPRGFDMDVGLMVAALAFAGPVAAVAIAWLPELIYLARRGRPSWHVGLLANHVSIVAAAFAGVAVLDLWPSDSVAPARLLTAGLAMLVANYVFAWLLLAVVRDGARPLVLLRTQLLPVLPLAMVAVAMGTVSALLVVSWVQLEALSIRQSETLLPELPYQRK